MTPQGAPAGTSAETPAPADRSVTDNLASLWHACHGFLHDVAELAALEARRAQLNLAGIVGCSIAAAVMAVTAWLLVILSIVSCAVDSGVSWLAVIAVAAIANFALAALLGYAVMQLSRHLLFAATRRQLAGGPSAGSVKARDE